MTGIDVDTTLALKEWSAVVHALLDGRQTLLLRKGGIREKRFDVTGDRFVLFPTVAHAHAERVRSEHAGLLSLGAADVDELGGSFIVRAGVELVDVVPTMRPEALDALAEFHIWTAEHARERMAFRPKHPLQILVVRARALPTPVRVARLAAYDGCSSWVDLPLHWDGDGSTVHDDERLQEVAARVRMATAQT